MSTFIVPLSTLPTITEIAGGAAKSQGGQAPTVPFADLLGNAMQNLETTGTDNRRNTYSLALGDSDDMHTGAIAAMKSQTAMTFASNFASAAIKAYNEILKMQI